METLKLSMKGTNFAFEPKVINAKAGQKVEANFSTVEGFHSFSINGVDTSISTGKVVSFTAPTAPGSYPFFCAVGSHRSMGMEGTLIVK